MITINLYPALVNNFFFYNQSKFLTLYYFLILNNKFTVHILNLNLKQFISQYKNKNSTNTNSLVVKLSSPLNFKNKLSHYKSYIKKTSYLFFYGFKFNSFSSFFFKRKSNFRVSLNKLITKTPFKQNRWSSFNNLKQNWATLIGGSVSPYYLYFINPKKWLRKLYEVSSYRNFNNVSKLNLLTDPTSQINYFLKKLILNSFFYNQSLFLNPYDTPYLLKIKNNNAAKNDKWLFTKPYNFLNNQSFNSNNYSNNFLINLFFRHSKIYSLLKKSPLTKAYSSKLTSYFKDFSFLTNHYQIVKTIKYSDRGNENFYSFRSRLTNTKIIKTFNSKNDNLIYYFNSFKSLKTKSRFSKKTYLFFLPLFLKKLTNNQLNRTFLVYKKNAKLNKCITLLSSLMPLKHKSFLNLFVFNWKIKPLLQETTISKFFFNVKYSWSFFNELSTVDCNFLFFLPTTKNKSTLFNKLYRPLILMTKEKNNFVSSKYGFLFLSNPFIFSNSNTLLNDIKKTLYSFSYKNELQRSILKRYAKTNFSLNILSNSSNNHISSFYSSDYSLDSDFNFKIDSFLKPSSSLSLFSFQSKNGFNANKNYFSWSEEHNGEYNFNLRKIKFKPGYMNIWREARTVLKLSLNLKIKYQHRLTKYLIKFNKFARFKTLLVNETSLINILVKSKFIPDFSSLNLFIKNGLFYVNGLPCLNQHFVLITGDLVQMVVSLKYYIFFKWMLNWNLKKKIRLKHLSWKKFSNNTDYEEKQKSKNLPKWILSHKFLILDIPNFLEVDYFTLSLFLVYEPFLLSDITFYNVFDNKFGINNMYNWKYIT